MTTFTNPEGLVITHTNECLETVLLQLSSSNIYYTTGNDDITFIKIGSNNTLLWDVAYNINRNIFQKHTMSIRLLIMS